MKTIATLWTEILRDSLISIIPFVLFLLVSGTNTHYSGMDKSTFPPAAYDEYHINSNLFLAFIDTLHLRVSYTYLSLILVNIQQTLKHCVKY